MEGILFPGHLSCDTLGHGSPENYEIIECSQIAIILSYRSPENCEIFECDQIAIIL